VKEAKGIANRAIIDEYHKTPKEDHHFRWAFGNTMRVIVTQDDLNSLIEIVLDEANGDSRDMFVRALAKLKSPRVRETLEHLINDKSKIVADEAKKALKRKRPAN
jgi:HEAT repeat protein